MNTSNRYQTIVVFKEANTSYPRSFKVVDYRKPTGVVTVFGFSLF